MTFKEKFNDFIGDITNKFTSLSQEENNSVEVEKEISEDDQRRLIDSFIGEIGENNDTNS